MLSQEELLELFDKDDYNIIVPNLYVSDYTFAINVNALLKNNIKCVISLMNDSMPKYITDSYRYNNIVHYHIIIADDPNSNITQHFDTTFNIIDNFVTNKQNILVHCMQGVSRSPTIIINYLAKKRMQGNYKNLFDKDIDSIIYYIRNIRSININGGFYKQLENIYK